MAFVTCDGGWIRKIDRICFSYLGTSRKKVCTVRKEGLAIIFGVKKFHQYLYGRHFTIYSDHRPLEHLFSENKSIPTLGYNAGHSHYVLMTTVSPTNLEKNMQMLTF